MFIGEEEFLFMQERLNHSSPVVTQLRRFQRDERGYTLSSVPIGCYKDDGSECVLNFSNSKRILILGSTGAGKTVLSSGIIDRFKLAGGEVSIFDLKGEYTKKNAPLQAKFSKQVRFDKERGFDVPKYLLLDEKPQGLSIKSYYPAFLQKLTRKKLDDTEVLAQFNLHSISKPDFLTLFENLTSSNSRYFDVLDALWTDITERELYSWEAIRDFFDSEASDYPSLQKRILLKYLKILRDNLVLGDTYENPDLISPINEGTVGILDLQGMTNYTTANSPALVYVAITLRKIYNAKVNSHINKRIHNLIMVDEINRFCPRMGNPSSKKEFLQVLDLSRSERISLLYSSQDYKRIPETLINQADYVFVSYKMGLDPMAELIRMVLPSEYGVPQTFKTKVARLQGRLQKYRDGRRDWLIIDRNNKVWDIIIPAMPLTHLVVEGE